MDNCIISGTTEIVEGYSAAVGIIGLTGRIIVILIFMALFQPESLAIFAVVIVTVLLIGFTLMQQDALEYQHKLVSHEGEELKILIEEALDKFQLIADYRKRPLICEMFRKAAYLCEHALKHFSIVKMNQRYTGEFLCALMVTIYIIVMGPAVLDGSLSLGIFLATIGIFTTTLSNTLKQFNSELLEIVDSFRPLKDFTIYMNMPLELEALKEISNVQRSQGEQRVEAMATEQSDSSEFKHDLLSISVHDMTFEYTPCKPVLENVSVDMPQGHLIAVTGSHGSGKRTFMQIMSNLLSPTKGAFFVPPHLRALHVTRDACLLQTTILGNLCLGLPVDSTFDIDRIYKILHLCGLEQIVDLIERDEAPSHSFGDLFKLSDYVHFIPDSAMAWHRNLTDSQRIRFHLARALISGADVVIIQRTLDGLNLRNARVVLEILKKHVRERGLILPPESMHLRRPRTIIYSTDRPRFAEKADMVFDIDPVRKALVRCDEKHDEEVRQAMAFLP
jgi:ABC-type multidrug transport system fused ATPase/permease subunit